MSANTIPDDVMRAAREAFDAYANGAGRDVRECIASAILAERQRCADVALEHAEAANSLAEAATSRQRKMASSAQFYIANNISRAILNPPSAASSRAEQTGEAEPPLASSPVTNSDWITWSGGECPVDPETQVEWRGRDGYSNISAAGNLDWRHWQIRPRRIEPDLSSGDIIAYRVVQHD